MRTIATMPNIYSIDPRYRQKMEDRGYGKIFNQYHVLVGIHNAEFMPDDSDP